MTLFEIASHAKDESVFYRNSDKRFQFAFEKRKPRIICRINSDGSLSGVNLTAEEIEATDWEIL